MSEKRKYPDNIVWDYENQKFHAHLLPYGSNLSAPKIELVNTDSFKKRGINKVEKIFNAELEEVIQNYYNLVEEVELNNLIYNSNYSFEPIVGETYHLYENNKGEYFLSIIKPNEWDEKLITSAKLNSDYKWVSIKDL